jgi:hypothetical protein
MAGWLILGLAVANLIVALTWTGNLVRYPGAERQAAGSLSQQSTYQTPDDLPKVLRWYIQHFSLSHEMPQRDSCVMVTEEDTSLFLQQLFSVTLCAHQKHTHIIVNRSLAAH